MNLRFLEKSEEKIWDDFVLVHKKGNIQQSSTWAHFQSSLAARDKYWIIVIEDKGEIVAGSLVLRMKLSKGFTWLYMPRGPLLGEDFNGQMKFLWNGLKELAHKENAIFLRIEPLIEIENSSEKNFNGFKFTNYGFQPEHSLIVDISKNENEILGQMKPKGRYNIKLARKKGVKIRKTNFENEKSLGKDIDEFYRIFNETTSRDGFSGHNKAFYKDMVKILGKENIGALYLAEYEGKVIAGLIATFYKDIAIYYYGASSNKYRNLMAPYLLQWEAILEARKHNCKYYDFLGIAPKGTKKHKEWKGITQFKRKFGGKEVSYLRAQEKAFNKFWYFVYRLYKWVR